MSNFEEENTQVTEYEFMNEEIDDTTQVETDIEQVDDNTKHEHFGGIDTGMAHEEDVDMEDEGEQDIADTSAAVPRPNTLIPNDLRPINDLTRASPEPGYLQYVDYIIYLHALGHLKATNMLATPLNSALQRDTGDRFDDLTDFRADQALWTMDNLPDILYSLGRPTGWLSKFDLKEPPKKQYQVHGKFLRDIPVLPDHISSGLEGWRYEAWVRLDPRIGHANIVDRIAKKHRPVNKSRIQMRTKRFRENFPLHGWVTKGKNYETDRDTIRAQVLSAGVPLAKNTTRGVSWGLVDSRQGEDGGRIAVPDAQRQPSTVDASKFDNTALSSSFPVSAPVSLTVPTKIFVAAPTALPKISATRKPTTSIINPTLTNPDSLIDPRLRDPTSQSITGNPPSSSTLVGPPPTPILPVRVPDTPPRQTPIAPTRQVRPRASQRRRQTPSPTQGPPRQVTVAYQGRILTLRSAEERSRMSEATLTMLLTFYPAASEERSRQLEYILDPTRATSGFLDNHGFYEPFPADVAVSCTDLDVIYI